MTDPVMFTKAAGAHMLRGPGAPGEGNYRVGGKFAARSPATDCLFAGSRKF